jgi:hypothetical protein
MPKPTPSHWLAYVGTFLAALAFAWNATAAWFQVKQDIHDLQEFNRYQYGATKVPKE